MEIFFRTNKLRKCCNQIQDATKEFGPVMAHKLLTRMSELDASASLAVFQKLPGPRCHPLKGNRAGCWAADLVHPNRLVFEIADDPVPLLPDGGVDIVQVRTIRILSVEDYHD